MKTAALIFLATVLCVNAISDEEARGQWEKFQVEYNRSYRSPVESQKRYNIFKHHLEEIEAHNELYKEGKVSWEEGVNQFTDWTEEELERYMNHPHGGLLNLFASEDLEIERKWNEFQATYKKSYRSPVESKKRFEIFRNNVIKMEEHNDLYEEGLVSDKQGINQFFDLTEEEFKEYVNRGLIHEEAGVGSFATEDDEETQRKWNEFQQQYQKSYRSPVEAQKRYSIFKQHLEEVEKINKLYDEGKLSWKAGINQFSDMTDEEMREYMGHGILTDVLASEDQGIERKWNDFQATFKKSYRSPVESKKRFDIFKNNVIKMEEHNDLYDQGLVSDKQGINKFSDWTEEEFKEYVNKGLNHKQAQVGSFATEDEEIQRKWNEFQATFKKSYRSPVESKKRFDIFKNNVIKMEEHNDLYDQGLVSDKQGINKFSDWTEEEFKDYVNNGLNIDGTLATEDEEIQRKWNEFQATFKKSYRSPVESKKRFDIFKNNVIKMEEHNDLYEQGLVSDKQGINKFSDWTEEEFKDYVNNGLNVDGASFGAFVLDDAVVQRKWNEFQDTFKKSYRSPVEARKRYGIFKKNLTRIELHNALYDLGLLSDREGINQFSDWTQEEFRDYVRNGLKH